MPNNDAPTMDLLMARIGYVLVHWGFIEQELRAQGRGPAELPPIPELEEARTIRNLIAHGIFEASVRHEAHIKCRAQNDETRRISYEQLGATIEALERGLGLIVRPR